MSDLTDDTESLRWGFLHYYELRKKGRYEWNRSLNPTRDLFRSTPETVKGRPPPHWDALLCGWGVGNAFIGQFVKSMRCSEHAILDRLSDLGLRSDNSVVAVSLNNRRTGRIPNLPSRDWPNVRRSSSQETIG